MDFRKTTLAVTATIFSVATAFAATTADAKPRAASPKAKTASTQPAPQASPGGKALQRGAASWYGPGFHGRRTANGETFNSGALTAAHRSLPFGSKVKVVNERTGRSVVVRINDRGPFHGNRIIDLSKGSAQAIGLSGVATVALYQL